MTKKVIYCEKCVGEIEHREDLVTSTSFLTIVPYHEKCYAKDLKGFKTISLSNYPINGITSNVATIIIFILGIIWLIVAEDLEKWVSILFLVPVIYRLYSYIVFERHLDK